MAQFNWLGLPVEVQLITLRWFCFNLVVEFRDYARNYPSIPPNILEISPTSPLKDFCSFTLVCKLFYYVSHARLPRNNDFLANKSPARGLQVEQLQHLTLFTEILERRRPIYRRDFLDYTARTIGHFWHNPAMYHHFYLIADFSRHLFGRDRIDFLCRLEHLFFYLWARSFIRTISIKRTCRPITMNAIWMSATDPSEWGDPEIQSEQPDFWPLILAVPRFVPTHVTAEVLETRWRDHGRGDGEANLAAQLWRDTEKPEGVWWIYLYHYFPGLTTWILLNYQQRRAYSGPQLSYLEF